MLPNLSNYSYLENDAASKYGHNVHKSTQNIVNCNLEPTLSLSLSLSLQFAARIFATKSNLRMHIKVKHIFETAREQSFSTEQNILHTLWSSHLSQGAKFWCSPSVCDCHPLGSMTPRKLSSSIFAAHQLLSHRLRSIFVYFCHMNAVHQFWV